MDTPLLFLVPPGGGAGARAVGMMDLRWTPDIVGGVGRPAHPGRRLAAVIVRAAAPGKTMRIPPMPQASAVRVPATDRMHSLEEGLRARLRISGISTPYLADGDQDEHQCRSCNKTSHAVSPPMPLGRHHLPGRIKVRAESPVMDPVTTTGRGRPTALSGLPAPDRPPLVRRHDHRPGGAAPSLRRGPDRR